MENKEEWIVFLDKHDIPAEQNTYKTREEAISAGGKKIKKNMSKCIN